jgi:hypothetical protein
MYIACQPLVDSDSDYLDDLNVTYRNLEEIKNYRYHQKRVSSGFASRL